MPDPTALTPAGDFAETAGVLVSARGLPRLPRPGRRPDPSRPATDLPGFGRVGYLAVGDTELAIFKTTQLGVHPGPKGEPLTRVPRSELVAVELDEHRVVAFLKLSFADGASWTLQVGRLHREAARTVATLLQRPARSPRRRRRSG